VRSEKVPINLIDESDRRWPSHSRFAIAGDEELVKFARRLGVKLTTKDLTTVTSADAADAPASEAVALGASEASVH
jgi:hypothetical protein